jgi:hypothetical protein
MRPEHRILIDRKVGGKIAGANPALEPSRPPGRGANREGVAAYIERAPLRGELDRLYIWKSREAWDCICGYKRRDRTADGTKCLDPST